MILEALKRSKPKEKNTLINILNKNKITIKDFNIAKNIITKSGAYDYCQALSKKLVKKSLIYLNQIKANQAAKKTLNYLANYIIERDY